MRNRLVLLPGWGLGDAPLQPLAAALRGLDERLQVQIEPLPGLHSSDPADWLDALDAVLPSDCWLGGWSLGGMLAAELAARRGDHCCGLVTLASNTNFVASSRWPAAMQMEDFSAFLLGCEQNPHATLKRFSLLCAQGGEEPRSLARQLAAAASSNQAGNLLHGLHVLAALDTRAALQSFAGPQLHLFAGADALVPAEAAGALLELLGDVEVGLIETACHAFVLERAHEVAAVIQGFLHEVGDE